MNISAVNKWKEKTVTSNGIIYRTVRNVSSPEIVEKFSKRTMRIVSWITGIIFFLLPFGIYVLISYIGG
jgi:hypothetical protein